MHMFRGMLSGTSLQFGSERFTHICHDTSLTLRQSYDESFVVPCYGLVMANLLVSLWVHSLARGSHMVNICPVLVKQPWEKSCLENGNYMIEITIGCQDFLYPITPLPGAS